jgi:two-component system sensor histidine kinase KdpD
VWTTVNVQHLESLNDLIVQTTGVQQRETLPDHVFDTADEVELIDLPPDDLLARLRAGKIYLQADAANAVERFFRKPNLMALREIALRRVADRVEAAARDSAVSDRHAHRSRLASDRVLVATGPDAQSEQLIRVGKRLADALDADWTVVYVETPALLKLSEAQRNRRIELMRLGESLGAETVTLDGPTAVEALLEYAATRHVTRVIVGSPKRLAGGHCCGPPPRSNWRRRARGFDVLTVAAPNHGCGRASRSTTPLSSWHAHALEPLWVGGGLSRRLHGPGLRDVSAPGYRQLVMVYLLGVTIAGLRLGRGPSVLDLNAERGIVRFPFSCHRVSILRSPNAQYLITFAVMLLISLVIATLMASVRQQTRVSGARERRTALLYAMSRELAATRGTANMCRIAVRHVAECFRCKVVVLLPDATGRLHFPTDPPGETALARRGSGRGAVGDGPRRQAGLGTDTLVGSTRLVRAAGRREPAIWVCWRSCPKTRVGCCCRSRATCWKHLPDRLA